MPSLFEDLASAGVSFFLEKLLRAGQLPVGARFAGMKGQFLSGKIEYRNHDLEE